ncbi:MAG: competence/damage-inducible protein A [Clostridia bacterium]|nr:competence/damage-inducible protein A [Clostridia bacterium]
MLTAEIICVGTELLMGQVLNTNEHFIASHLPEAGIALNHSSVVGDNPQRLKDALLLAKSRSDIIIMTGGLGPTDDDLTKETVAQVFGKKLVFHAECMDKMVSYLKESGKNLTKNNEKQAYLPEGSIVIENNNGTAPGCIIEDDGKAAIMLPGPPREMVPMFNETVLPYLKNKSGTVLYSRVLRLFGIGESRAAAMCDDLIKNQTNPTIAPYAKEGEVTFRVTASAENEATAKAMADETVSAMYERLGEYIYGEGDETSLAEVVVNELNKKKLTVSTAESCTGGLIGKMITEVSGASSVYGFGFVTYANEAKMQLVGVKHETLEKYGAVSEETAKEMAEGARRVSGSDIAVSVTGIAGPTGGTKEKPVGLVYIGISDKQGCEVFRFVQHGDRERVRNKSALCALDIIRRRIQYA